MFDNPVFVVILLVIVDKSVSAEQIACVDLEINVIELIIPSVGHDYTDLLGQALTATERKAGALNGLVSGEPGEKDDA